MESVGRGIWKADKDRGMGLKEYDGVGTKLADIDDDDRTFCGSRLEIGEWRGL
jgi:hypothetical protein